MGDPVPAREKTDYSLAQKSQAGPEAQRSPIGRVLAALIQDKKRLSTVHVECSRG